MTAIIVFGVLIGLVVAGLQRNHVRENAGTGEAAPIDRDAERVVADLVSARR